MYTAYYVLIRIIFNLIISKKIISLEITSRPSEYYTSDMASGNSHGTYTDTLALNWIHMLIN